MDPIIMAQLELQKNTTEEMLAKLQHQFSNELNQYFYAEQKQRSKWQQLKTKMRQFFTKHITH